MHDHKPYGSPYDHTKKICCPACIEIILKSRRELCDKYGWAEWPEDLKGSLLGE